MILIKDRQYFVYTIEIILLYFKSFKTSRVLLKEFLFVGWAYDLKTVDPELIRRRVNRTGDGSHKLSDKNVQEQLIKDSEIINNEQSKMVWGWDDPEMDENDRKLVKINHEEK